MPLVLFFHDIFDGINMSVFKSWGSRSDDFDFADDLNIAHGAWWLVGFRNNTMERKKFCSRS